MLTRVEIDGFKSFDRLGVNLSPFSVVVGPNAAGKSNFFDALRLLGRLAETDIRSAVQDLRGEPTELFRIGADGTRGTRMALAVEVLLDREFKDAYGTPHKLAGTRLRYEVTIERRTAPGSGVERLYLTHESARLIGREHDRFLRMNPSVSADYVPKTSKKPVFISTGEHDVTLRHEGAGRPRTFPLREASSTVLFSVRTAEDLPHLFALRQELAALTFLQLSPESIRAPVDVLAPDVLLADGSNLPMVLARIQDETRSEDRPQGALADIRMQLAGLIPGVTDLDVVLNEAARQRQVFVTMRDGMRVSSRVLSDGTLRILALLTLLNDPRRRGTVCFEEPENGVHEARIEGLVEVLRAACTRLDEAPRAGEKLSQIIVNTHSPEVMRHLLDEELIAADTVVRIEPSTSSASRRTRMRRVRTELPGLATDETLSRYEANLLLRRDAPEAASA